MDVSKIREDFPLLKLVQLRLFGREQSVHQPFVSILVHRAVDVIARAVPVAVAHERAGHIHRFPRDDGGGCVVKPQRAAREAGDLRGERLRRQRSRRHDRRRAAVEGCHFSGEKRDVRMPADAPGELLRKRFAVYRKGVAGGNAGLVRGGDDRRAQDSHFLF